MPPSSRDSSSAGAGRRARRLPRHRARRRPRDRADEPLRASGVPAARHRPLARRGGRGRSAGRAVPCRLRTPTRRVLRAVRVRPPARTAHSFGRSRPTPAPGRRRGHARRSRGGDPAASWSRRPLPTRTSGRPTTLPAVSAMRRRRSFARTSAARSSSPTSSATAGGSNVMPGTASRRGSPSISRATSSAPASSSARQRCRSRCCSATRRASRAPGRARRGRARRSRARAASDHARRAVAGDEAVDAARSTPGRPGHGGEERAAGSSSSERRQRGAARPAAAERVDDVERGIALLRREVAQEHAPAGDPIGVDRDPAADARRAARRRVQKPQPSS